MNPMCEKVVVCQGVLGSVRDARMGSLHSLLAGIFLSPVTLGGAESGAAKGMMSKIIQIWAFREGRLHRVLSV